MCVLTFQNNQGRYTCNQSGEVLCNRGWSGVGELLCQIPLCLFGVDGSINIGYDRSCGHGFNGNDHFSGQIIRNSTNLEENELVFIFTCFVDNTKTV